MWRNGFIPAGKIRKACFPTILPYILSTGSEVGYKIEPCNLATRTLERDCRFS